MHINGRNDRFGASFCHLKTKDADPSSSWGVEILGLLGPAHLPRQARRACSRTSIVQTEMRYTTTYSLVVRSPIPIPPTVPLIRVYVFCLVRFHCEVNLRCFIHFYHCENFMQIIRELIGNLCPAGITRAPLSQTQMVSRWSCVTLPPRSFLPSTETPPPTHR